LKNENFTSILCDLIRRFPEHGIVHQEVTKFVFEIVRCGGDFVRDLILEILPVVVDGMKSESVILRAFAWNFQKSLEGIDPESEIGKVVRREMEKQPEFEELFRKLDVIVQTPFGGELPQENGQMGEQARLMMMNSQKVLGMEGFI
jgi:hypothetical protein